VQAKFFKEVHAMGGCQVMEEAKGLSKIKSEDNPLRLQMRFVLIDYTM
jgi:hypothetical protein